MPMIERLARSVLVQQARGFPVVAITGPRQSGKTTLARLAFPDKPYASLEDPDIQALVARDPRRFLAGFPDGAIIDEAQRLPKLFSWLQAWSMNGAAGATLSSPARSSSA